MPEDTKAPAPKPGYKTTEFWLSTVATLAGIVLASGAVADGSQAAQIVGGIVAVLATLGYTGARAKAKQQPPSQK